MVEPARLCRPLLPLKHNISQLTYVDPLSALMSSQQCQFCQVCTLAIVMTLHEPHVTVVLPA